MLVLMLLIMVKASDVSAQNGMVTGKVLDDNGPVPGVGIMVKGTSNGTSSGADGSFSIKAGTGDVLVFSSLGYEDVEIAIKSHSPLTVTLTESAEMLQEVVAIGYGTLKKSSVTSSIAKIGSDELSERPVVRLDQALQGKLAGVNVTETTGEPGMAPTIMVRGINSINHASGPLWVVDGFPVSADFRGFNPSDIESIEVLKDASAAAIYGSRGSGGVILVTTKSGRKGKPTVSLDMSYGLQERFSKVDVLDRDEWIEYAIEERTNSYLYNGGDPSIPEEMRSSHKYGIDPLWRTHPDLFPDNDWQDIIDRVSPRQNYSMSVSGGTDNVKYYTSVSWLDQKGIIINTGYKRLSFQGNVEAKASEWLSMGTNIHASYSDRSKTEGGIADPVGRSVLVSPVIGIDNQTLEGGMYKYCADFHLNPYHLATETENKDTRTDFLGNAYLKITPVAGLELKSSIGFNKIDYNTEYFIDRNVNRGNPSSGTWGSNYRKNILNENTVTYNLDLDGFTVNLLGGFTYQNDYYFVTSFSKKDFTDDSIRVPNGATTINHATGSATENTLMSWLLRGNFSYADRYFLSASIRTDGSSRFGRNKRWGWFPAVSGGWMISSEPWFSSMKKTVSNLKLRASYGSAGNNSIGDYSAIGALSNANGVFGNVVAGGYVPAGFSNPDLTWEKTNTTDLGMDLGLLSNRVNLSLDYYYAETRDMLLNVPVPETTGFSSAIQNIGSMRNSGFETELETKNLVGKFSWTTSFNFSYNSNKVLSLGPDDAPIIVESGGFPVSKIEVGKPLRYFYLLKQDGLFKDEDDCIINKDMSYKNHNPQPGDIKYKDINGDGIISEDDRTDCGKGTPDIHWGLTNTFSLYGFDVSIFLDGISDCSILNVSKSEDTQSRSNVRGYWRNRWRSEENPGNGRVPRACATDNLTVPSDWWLEDGKYWRIRNINVGYRLPSRLMAKSKVVSSCRLYFSMDNVYMHDHYYHLPLNQGGWTSYPIARTYEVGVNLKF